MWRPTLHSIISLVYLSGIIEAHSVNVSQTCNTIKKTVSSKTIVSFPGSEAYLKDNFHWLSSSTDASVCSVEPGTVEDLQNIVKIVGSTRTPFNVKGAGHGTNPHQAASSGVQIAMFQFSQVTYNPNSKTVDIGTGLTWDTVYKSLEPFGQVVVGGQLPTVGVPGFVLGGGGYSWLSNQHGLTIDTVVSFDLVLPNGSTEHVTSSSNPDLFFALKGGYNNYGIVYTITLNTFEQGLVWGGPVFFTEAQIPAVNEAFVDFSLTNTDPKAQIIAQYGWNAGSGNALALALFYDAPTPPPGLFDRLMSLPSASNGVKSSSTLYNFVQSLASNVTDFDTTEPRGLWHNVGCLNWSTSILNVSASQSSFFQQTAAEHGLISLKWSVETFLPTYFNTSKGGAYPHNPNLPLKPLAIMWNYNSSSSDEYALQGVHSWAAAVEQQAISEGQNIGGPNQIRYTNYAVFDTPLSELYGQNVPRLKSIKARYDPQNIMGLAGGFKIPL